MSKQYAKNKAFQKRIIENAKGPKTPNVNFGLANAAFESSLPDLISKGKKIMPDPTSSSGFTSMDPDEPADVYQISRALNKFRRPDDQLPVMNEQGDFVKNGKRKPLSTHLSETPFQDILPRLKGKGKKTNTKNLLSKPYKFEFEKEPLKEETKEEVKTPEEPIREIINRLADERFEREKRSYAKEIGFEGLGSLGAKMKGYLE